jgi:uncharacterized membrane protein (DUF485 family)
MINIIKKTILYIAEEKSNLHVLLFFFCFPFLIATLPLFFNFQLNEESESGNIISGLSLFIGFFFSLIFVISDRVQLKKDELTKLAEIDLSRKARLNEYIDFGQKLVGTITSTVYISLILIVLILLSEVRFNFKWISNNTTAIVFQTINLYLGTNLLYLIVFILNEMYDFFYGQIGEK